MSVSFSQLVAKRYPVKAVRTLEKKGEAEEEENYFLQTEPTWEHKALSGTDSFLSSLSYGKPPKRGRIQPEERL